MIPIYRYLLFHLQASQQDCQEISALKKVIVSGLRKRMDQHLSKM